MKVGPGPKWRFGNLVKGFSHMKMKFAVLLAILLCPLQVEGQTEVDLMSIGRWVAGDHIVARDPESVGQRLAPATKVDTM